MRFESIEGRIAAGERLIIHCAASWNSDYHQKMSTALSQIPVSVHGAEVVLLDTDEEASWVALREWGVRNLPALVLFARETHLGTIVGCRSAPDLANLLADLFNTTTTPKQTEFSMIDWKSLAENVGSLKDGQESGSRDYAQAAIERIIGVENIREAVDHYVVGDPGAGLIRSVIWHIHPFSAMERCYEIYKHDPDLRNRRMAVELLRVAADRRVLPWIEEFLNDEDQSIRAWGFGIVDQLLWSELVWENEAAHLIELAEKSSDDYLREKAVFVRDFLRDRQVQQEFLRKHQGEEA